MSLTLIIADDSYKEMWDAIVETSPHATIFHTWDWMKLAEKHTRSRLEPLLLLNGTQPVALYPVFLLQKGPARLAFSPPPKAYLLYLGPVIHGYERLKQDKKESVFSQIQKIVDDYLFGKLGCNYVRIRTSPGLPDSRPLKWAGYKIDPLYTYRIDLAVGLQRVREMFDRKLRVDINRAVKEGVTVRMGDWEDLVFLHDQLFRRYISQGVNPSDYTKYLRDLYDRFYPDNLKIFIAEYQGNRVGGTINLCYKDVMYLWVGVPKSDLVGVSPNDLVQWEAIKWASEHGLRYYEEMDAGDDPRLTRFKAKYNPETMIWFSATRYSSNLYKVAESVLHKLKGP
jgi:hypothetical protein